MQNSSNFFYDTFCNNPPSELVEFASQYQCSEDLLNKLGEDPSFLIPVIQNIKITPENETLAARIIRLVKLNHIKKTENYESVKKVETALRNRNALKYNPERIISFQGITEENSFASVDKLLLCLESPYFYRSRSWKDFRQEAFLVDTDLITKEAYQLALEYLQLSDEQRRSVIKEVDRSLLPVILQLASYWELEELFQMCEEELIKHLNEFSIETEEELSYFINLSEGYSNSRSASISKFISRVAEGNFNQTIEEMFIPKSAYKLASLCSKEEKEVFSSLETEFGRYCRVLRNTRTFGPVEWEQYYGLMIDDVPSISGDILERLNCLCPYFTEDGKSVFDTHVLFLLPKGLSLNKMDKLAKSSIEGGVMGYSYFWLPAKKKHGQEEIERSYWVLMTNDIIPYSRGVSRSEQLTLVSKVDDYVAPSLLEAVVCNLVFYASSNGERLFSDEPWTYTCCREEPIDGKKLVVGGFSSTGIKIFYNLNCTGVAAVLSQQ